MSVIGGVIVQIGRSLYTALDTDVYRCLIFICRGRAVYKIMIVHLYTCSTQ